MNTSDLALTNLSDNTPSFRTTFISSRTTLNPYQTVPEPNSFKLTMKAHNLKLRREPTQAFLQLQVKASENDGTFGTWSSPQNASSKAKMSININIVSFS